MARGLCRNRPLFARVSFGCFRFALEVNFCEAYLRYDIRNFFVCSETVLLHSAHNLFRDDLQSWIL